MARDITSGFEAEIEASVLSPITLLKAEFDSGNVYMWTGIGNIIFGADTYLGVGNFLSIDDIEETQELRAASAKFKLSGIPSSMLSLALNESYQGRPIWCYFGVLDSSGSLIADPYLMFKGRMDIMQISDDADMASVTVSAENDLIDLRTIRERKYTPEDQKAQFNGDLGLDFVPKIQDTQISWGVGII